MIPENDIKNPYLWLIMFISIIPAIPAHFIFNYYVNSFLVINLGYFAGLFGSIIFVTLPIFITYWVLWIKYTKSKDFKRRYPK